MTDTCKTLSRVAILISCIAASQVAAQDKLGDSLEQLNRRQDVKLVFDPSLVAGKTVDLGAVDLESGDPETLLRILLARTDLGIQKTSNGTFVIVRLSESRSDAPDNSESVPREAPQDRIEEVVVYGFRGQTQQAVASKRDANEIAEFIHADVVAQHPDYNIADAIRRVSGVVTIFDEDEGRYVAMRGMDADFTYVTMDDSALAALDLGGGFGGGRRVLLEAIPSFAIKTVEIKKSFAADRDGQGIGGHINLLTRSAFDTEGIYSSNFATVGYYDSTDYPTSDNGPSYRFESAFSNSFGADRQFGVLATVAYMFKDRDQERSSPGNYRFFTSDLQQVDDPSSGNYDFAVPRFIVNRGYRNEIERIGGLFKLEFQPTDRVYAFLEHQHFQQNDNEERTGLFPNAGSLAAWDGQFYTIEGADITARLQAWDIEKTVTSTLGRLELEMNEDHSLRLSASHSGSEWTEDAPRTAFFTSRVVDYRGEPGSDSRSTRFYVDDPDSAFFDTDQFNRFDARHRFDKETEDVAEFALDYAFNAGNRDSGLGFKSGLRYRRTDREFDRDQFRYRQGDDFDLRLTDYVLDDGFIPFQATYPIIVMDVDRLTALISSDPQGRPGQFRLDEGWSNARSRDDDFAVKEDVLAAYALGVHEGERHRFEVGLRIEQTDVQALANQDLTRISEVSGEVVTLVEEGSAERSGQYRTVLPSLGLMYDVREGLRLRSMFSQSIGRPSYSSIAGTVSIREDEITGETFIEEGNPDLNPRVSNNYDLSLEYYYDQGRSLVSAGLFYKDIEDDIFVRTSTQGLETRVRPENVESSSTYGLELNVVKNSFDFLPAPWDGLGFSATASFIRARMQVDDGTELKFRPEQPETIYNASLFYESGPIEARLTLNHTGEHAVAVNLGTPYLTRWEQDFTQIDAALTYQINDEWRVRLQGRNLTNEERIINEGPGQRLIWDYSQFGPQYWLGFTYKPGFGG